MWFSAFCCLVCFPHTNCLSMRNFVQREIRLMDRRTAGLVVTPEAARKFLTAANDRVAATVAEEARRISQDRLEAGLLRMQRHNLPLTVSSVHFLIYRAMRNGLAMGEHAAVKLAKTLSAKFPKISPASKAKPMAKPKATPKKQARGPPLRFKPLGIPVHSKTMRESTMADDES